MNDAPLYHERESIQPRAFAVRHLVIQEVKFRKQRAPGAALEALLDRVARGVDVEYEAATHAFIIRCERLEIRRMPLAAFALYARGDHTAPHNVPDATARRWDHALESNRARVVTLVDAMLAALLAALGGAATD